MSNAFAAHLRQQGTIRLLTVHDSSPSNGIAECCNGVLVEHVRALLVDSGLPKFLWKEALKYAMWIRNRTTTHLLNGMTPYEAFYGVKPDIGDIHLWGSRVWVRDLTAGKLDPRGREGRFIGYNFEGVFWTKITRWHKNVKIGALTSHLTPPHSSSLHFTPFHSAKSQHGSEME